jgi:hypothetical protein
VEHPTTTLVVILIVFGLGDLVFLIRWWRQENRARRERWGQAELERQLRLGKRDRLS